jgi:NitT/TauT family transport system substrate-binding protein
MRNKLVGKQILKTFLAAVLIFVSTLSMAKEATIKPIKVGVLKFGTVNWVLNVIKHHELDKKHGVDLQITGLGSKKASHVSIQGGAVDMIVSDWIWVSRQRAENRDYTFVPYSNATGSVMVKKDSPIKTLADFEGKKLGVAGGPVDKSWLFLRAYTQKTLGKDMAKMVEPSFGAPPLLNKLAKRDEVDGALNFWHFTAKLKTAGFRPIVTMPDVLKELGVDRPIPIIGWVFSEEFGAKNTEVVNGFIKASEDAKKLLLESDAEWERIRPKMKAKSDDMFVNLRDAFRAGVPRCFGDAEKAASGFTLLGTVALTSI